MVTLSHNPNTYFNSYISITRSMMVTTSLSLGLFTYSTKTTLFDTYHVKYISMIILLFGILYGLKGGEDFKRYTYSLEKTLKENKQMQNREIYLLELPSWKQWIDLTTLYIFVLSAIEIFLVYKVFFQENN